MMIADKLFLMQDLKYREFHSKLMPSVAKDKVIGIRVPEIRKFAKEIYGTSEAERFLKSLPHTYYEENNLHAFLIEKIPDYNEALEAIETFLPYIDNWATCDMLTPKSFKKNLTDCQVISWLDSPHPYTVRFAIGMLMKFFLDDKFKPEYLEFVSSVKSDEYYVNMMIAWYFATALAKQYDDAVKYIEMKVLPQWVHNKTIQKSIESLRIPKEKKDYLRTLK